MNKEQIYKSLDEIKPNKEQKERMLKNILNQQKKSLEVQKEGKFMKLENIRKEGVKKWIGLAASFVIIVGTGIAWQQSQMVTPPLDKQEAIQTPVGSPMGVRKIMNYGGYRYAFINNGESFTLKEESLKKELGQVPEDATFAVGGKIYELSGYNTDFRMAVKWNNQYYIAENVAKADNSPIDIKEYFKAIDLKEKVEKVEILDHMGMQVLKELSSKEANLLIDTFSQAQVASLTREDYEAIGKAQSTGKSYKIVFTLKDGTTLEQYVIPEMNYVTIGDYRCTLETLGKQIGNIFEGLKQDENLPMQ